ILAALLALRPDPRRRDVELQTILSALGQEHAASGGEESDAALAAAIAGDVGTARRVLRALPPVDQNWIGRWLNTTLSEHGAAFYGGRLGDLEQSEEYRAFKRPLDQLHSARHAEYERIVDNALRR